MLISCTICTEVVEPEEYINALRCGHVFHNNCLSRWLVRSKTCPQCRSKVTQNCMVRLYPTLFEDRSLTPSNTTLQHAFELYTGLQQVCVKKEESLKKATDDLKRSQRTMELYKLVLRRRIFEVATLRQRLEKAEPQARRLHQEKILLNTNIKTLKGEIDRQNLLYNELMGQVNLQRQCLDARSKETEQLRDQNRVMKKQIMSLTGTLRKYKSRHGLNAKVPVPNEYVYEQRPPCSKTYGGCSVNKVVQQNISRWLAKLKAKKNEVLSSQPTESSNTLIEKLDYLSLKLHLVKTSQLKLSNKLVNLLVAWLETRLNNRFGSNSHKTSSQACDEEYINRLTEYLFIDDNTEELSSHAKVNKNKSGSLVAYDIKKPPRSKASVLKKKENATKIKGDVKKMIDFFAELGKGTRLPKFSKDNTNWSSMLPSSVIEERNLHKFDYKMAIRTFMLSLKDKNFVSVDGGACSNGNTEKTYDFSGLNMKFTLGTNIKLSKPKRRKDVKTIRRMFSKVKRSKAGFEFDGGRLYVGLDMGSSLHQPAVFKFEARPLPNLPPMPKDKKKKADRGDNEEYLRKSTTTRKRIPTAQLPLSIYQA